MSAAERGEKATELDISTLLRLARCGHVQFDPANQATARYRLDLHDLDYRYFLAEYESLATAPEQPPQDFGEQPASPGQKLPKGLSARISSARYRENLTVRPAFTHQADELMRSGCPEDAAFYWSAILVEASERATGLWGALERLTEWAEGYEGEGCHYCRFSMGHNPDGCIVAGARARLDGRPQG